MDPHLQNYYRFLSSDSSTIPTSSQNPDSDPTPDSPTYNNPNLNLPYNPNSPTEVPSFPVFASQWGVGFTSMDPPRHTPPPPDRRQKKGISLATLDVAPAKRKAWSINEDKVLISGYLNTSKDCIVGTDQSGTKFWDRVGNYYNEHKPSFEIARDSRGCKNRWHLINASVGKFVGAYNQASARKKSGEAETDVLFNAHKIYEADGGKKFQLEHAWYVLRNEPKWMRTPQESSSKRTKINQEGLYSSSSEPGTPGTPCTPVTPSAQPYVDVDSLEEDVDVPARPIGVKAAKKKAKENARSKDKGDNAVCDKELKMNELIDSQSRLATALSENARTKKWEVYAKLLGKATLTEREERALAALEAELL